MQTGKKFRCKGVWNNEAFERVIEAEDEGDARDHWWFWAWISQARLENLEIIEVEAA
ncbi:hypothetical protein [Enterobacter soli]|uniref:hypothetical protein n=1 Tax=Enterobacter soli TaxID=885040 RepID=UPI00372E2D52